MIPDDSKPILFFEKKSGVVVEAVRLNENNAEAVAVWSGAQVVEEIDPEHPEEKQPGLNVPTRSGIKRASLGQYVVRFQNEHYVARTRVFEEKYEALSQESAPNLFTERKKI